MIKGVIFDMDGLMFDTERIAMESWISIGKQTGWNITKSILTETLGLNVDKTMQVFQHHLGAEFDFPTTRKMKAEYMTEYIEKKGLPIKSGLIQLLDYLKSNNYKMTVATSAERERAENNIIKAGIDGYFKKIVADDMIEYGKPDPDIYIQASRVLELNPSECLALEDSPVGILSAYKAGMKVIMIPDVVQPDGDIQALLFRKLSSLDQVIDVLIEDRNKHRNRNVIYI